MKNLDPQFIDSFALEVSRLSRAIQSIQKLDEYLPSGFPPPCAVMASRKPFDLVLRWEPSTSKQQLAICQALRRAWGLSLIDWREETGHLVCRQRVKLAGKNSLNLSLTIKLPRSSV